MKIILRYESSRKGLTDSKVAFKVTHGNVEIHADSSVCIVIQCKIDSPSVNGTLEW